MAHDRKEDILRFAFRHVSFKARHLIGTYGFTENDIDDIKQELLLDLLERIDDFDPEKGTPATFVARIVERRIANMIRYKTQELRDYRRVSCSLDERVRDESGRMVYRYSTISSEEVRRRMGRSYRSEYEEVEIRLDNETVLDSLPSELQRTAELMRHHSMKETADILRVHRSTVYFRILRLRDFFYEI